MRVGKKEIIIRINSAKMSFLFAISINLMSHLVTCNGEYYLSNFHPNSRNNPAIVGNYTANLFNFE